MSNDVYWLLSCIKKYSSTFIEITSMMALLILSAVSYVIVLFCLFLNVGYKIYLNLQDAHPLCILYLNTHCISIFYQSHTILVVPKLFPSCQIISFSKSRHTLDKHCPFYKNNKYFRSEKKFKLSRYTFKTSRYTL